MKRKGFTLIEMLIVVILIGILMPVTFNIIFTILQQQVKIYKLVETRRQGDSILLIIKDRIMRDAARIENQNGSAIYCDQLNETFTSSSGNNAPGNGDMSFVDNAAVPNRFMFYESGPTLFFSDPPGAPLALNGARFDIQNFVISCAKVGPAKPIVSFSFDIRFIDNEPIPTTLHYSSRVRIRR